MSAQSKQQEFLQKFLNSKRKVTGCSSNKNSTLKTDTKSSSSNKIKEEEIEEDWLTKKALDEIQKSADLHKVKRQSQDLTTTEPKAKTNKKFLQNTLSNCLSHNQRESNRHMANSSNKLKELDRYHRLRNSQQKFGERKHAYKKPEKRKDSDDDGDE